MISTAHQGRPSRIELGRRLIESGALSSDWAPSFAAVDRTAFLPDRMWPFVPAAQAKDPSVGTSARVVCIDRNEDPAAWYGYADSDLSIVTQWDDGGHRGTSPGVTPTSSSSQPTVVFQLLGALDVDQGMRVLDAGTGTGETAGLLAHRCGARGVTTIDVDASVVASARERLCAAGLYADVAVGDALAGHPANAPYDRLLCTFGVRTILAPWIQQVRPGGVIVAPYGTHYSSRDAAVHLTVGPDGTASGPFIAGVEFMKARAQRTVWPQHGDYVTEWPGPTGTAFQPDDLSDTDAEFTIALAVPGVTHTVYREDDGTRAAWFYSLTDRSWACVRWPDEYGPGVVPQHGPRRLWDGVEAALAWWHSAGRPGVTRFGLTITPEAATPWVDEPGNPLPGARWR
ncbi:methyltransferase domain-containing protein [Streptomyces sp. NPDC001389]|uniref:methyltransferase domain-containing protein n=1 Tax=Streptomyces sp. NPDC001389 TaxID=3364569 RepID=UPI00367D53DC